MSTTVTVADVHRLFAGKRVLAVSDRLSRTTRETHIGPTHACDPDVSSQSR